MLKLHLLLYLCCADKWEKIFCDLFHCLVTFVGKQLYWALNISTCGSCYPLFHLFYTPAVIINIFETQPVHSLSNGKTLLQASAGGVS